MLDFLQATDEELCLPKPAVSEQPKSRGNRDGPSGHTGATPAWHPEQWIRRKCLLGRGGCKLAPESQGYSAPESSSLPHLESFKMPCNVSVLLSLYVGGGEGVSGRGGGGCLFVFPFCKVSCLEHVRVTMISNCSILRTVYY